MLLQKRYNKAREKQGRSKEWGISRDEMFKKCGDVKGYEVLSWLTPFIVTRQTKWNLSIVEDDTATSNDSFENTPGPSHANNTKNYFESGEDDDEDGSPVLGGNENVVVGKRPNFYSTIPPISPPRRCRQLIRRQRLFPGSPEYLKTIEAKNNLALSLNNKMR